MDKIIASTQENEWTGSIALDDADELYLREYALKHGHIGSSDQILGFKVTNLTVCLYYEKDTYLNLTQKGKDPKMSEFDISITEFFDLFKRVSFAVSRRNIGNGLA